MQSPTRAHNAASRRPPSSHTQALTVIAETALPPENDPYRLDQTERQKDARFPHQDLLRVFEIDRLEGNHTQFAHCEHPEVKRVQIQ